MSDDKKLKVLGAGLDSLMANAIANMARREKEEKALATPHPDPVEVQRSSKPQFVEIPTKYAKKLQERKVKSVRTVMRSQRKG